MSSSASQGLREVPFAVTDPERIPAQRYFDEEFYNLEVEHLWPHAWQMACRLEQIPEVGDWYEYHNLGASVIVVRTADGVKAFHNACRHRGVPLTGNREFASGNCAKTGFVCPFHGWRWNMDGENTFVYGRHLFSERQLDPADINLQPCRVEVWGGCAWINLDDDAPSVKECFGPVADRLEVHGIADLKMEWWYGTHLPANWKIAMEAFMEGYHVATTHPQLKEADGGKYYDTYNDPVGPEGGDSKEKARKSTKPGVTTREAVDVQILHMERLSEGMAGMVHAKEVEVMRDLRNADLPEDPAVGVPMWFGMVNAEITRRLRERGEPTPDLNAIMQSDPVHAVEFLFPHYFVLPLFTSMSAYRIRPTGPETCFFEIWSLTMYPEDADYEAPTEPTILPFDSQDFPPIPRQDYSNIPIQQKGMHAKGFEYMRLAEGVEGLVSNYQRLIDGYLAGYPLDRLAKANHALGGNFDGPVLEMKI